jgi:hypothetical protein
MIKNLVKLYNSLIYKGHSKNHIGNIIPNNGRAFPLSLESKKECPPITFNQHQTGSHDQCSEARHLNKGMQLEPKEEICICR